MANIGIVGHAADKFTPSTEQAAKNIINSLLKEGDILVSGHSPLGGIDIWAEENADSKGIGKVIFEPNQLNWNGKYGYKARNIDIAETSDIVHVIVVQNYPPDYEGIVFDECYHCNKSDHVKSGGCWTGQKAKKLGNKAKWHIIKVGALF